MLVPNVYFNGTIDDVRVYNRALSSTEIHLLANPPVGYWPLDGNALDFSGTAHGTLKPADSGTQWINTGYFGSSLNFNMANKNYVLLNNAGLSGDLKPAALPITVSAWIKPASRVVSVIFHSDQWDNTLLSGYDVRVEGGGHLQCSIGTGVAGGRRTKTGSTIVPLGVWSHVVAVIRGPRDMVLYLEGQNDGGVYSGSGVGPMVYSAAASKIGSDGNVYFNGEIDDVRVYNRELSFDEVKSLHSAATGILPPQ